MKIKVCGMRDAENIQSLLALKPDFIGFIFYNKSKRFVEGFPQVDFPKGIKKVGVFVNENIDVILDKVKKYQLNVVQLHGNETPEYCAKLHYYKLEVIKAFSVDENFNFNSILAYENSCNYFLFDTKGTNYGGNGIKFNWEILQKYRGNVPFLLSGGISKNDVSEIQKIMHSAFEGVDINSGFEIEPALKNINEIKEFKENLI
ncbi:MAG: phosphoribosylanthranilate isomerase [Lutibacter sp.]|uniref:phosphoribosylanthranilate isomerase n=1 Tax=Lutibacter sp. TaxID=1925666 RepID=UPI00299CE0B1|nr:phosphoribosylanthranilate isomerase [Lutibacter sp.]MDX1829023.1 phosphoribosylanthranilate isomerase [Lutibacter sp.]